MISTSEHVQVQQAYEEFKRIDNIPERMDKLFIMIMKLKIQSERERKE